jgi:hypothetical protein
MALLARRMIQTYHQFTDTELLPPANARELPVLYWDKRPSNVELTVRDAVSALWLARGNITKAAEILRIH